MESGCRAFARPFVAAGTAAAVCTAAPQVTVLQRQTQRSERRTMIKTMTVIDL
jgi:hypothetical protein